MVARCKRRQHRNPTCSIPNNPERRRRPRRVLVVDDDDGCREVLAFALGHAEVSRGARRRRRGRAAHAVRREPARRDRPRPDDARRRRLSGAGRGSRVARHREAARDHRLGDRERHHPHPRRRRRALEAVRLRSPRRGPRPPLRPPPPRASPERFLQPSAPTAPRGGGVSSSVASRFTMSAGLRRFTAGEPPPAASPEAD